MLTFKPSPLASYITISATAFRIYDSVRDCLYKTLEVVEVLILSASFCLRAYSFLEFTTIRSSSSSIWFFYDPFNKIESGFLASIRRKGSIYAGRLLSLLLLPPLTAPFNYISFFISSITCFFNVKMSVYFKLFRLLNSFVSSDY